jgi:signal transduction histidine kinase/CheY-like chemotaxis protein
MRVKNMNLKSVKIRTRLIIGFGVIGLMVVTMGLVAFFQMKVIWENTHELYEHPFKVNIAVREIQTDLTAVHRSLKDYILCEGQHDMNRYEKKMEKHEQAVESNFKIVYEFYLGDKTTIDSAYNAFREWELIRDSTIFLRREGKVREAAYRTTHEAELNVDRIMDRVQTLSDFAMAKADLFYASAEKSKNQLQIQLWLIIVAIFILTLIIAYSIFRAISIPIRSLVEVAEEYRIGNYTVRSDIGSLNEIGQLAASFNRMAEGIQGEIEIKSGISEVTDSMLGHEVLGDFLRSLLGSVIDHTNSDMGAIYLLNEQNSLFEPRFSIGLKSENLPTYLANSFEGEFGKTLMLKDINHIKNIPYDTNFDFAAVAGTFKPKEILNIPILASDEVVAVISLANFHSYSHQVMEMLRIARKSLSSGVISILSFQKVRDYSQKLDIQNTELELQTRELKLQAEELQEQNAELEMQKRQIDEANRLKSDFLSSMSHELRTPLNAVIALSGVLGRKLVGKIPDKEYSYLEIIERNGNSLLTLINEILDLSRIESGRVDVQYSTFSIREAVSSIFDTLQLQIQKKDIKAVNLISHDFPLVSSDRTKCHHIIQNLISNAVKFTDEGSVEVSAEIIDLELRLTVSDTGIGISTDNLPRIFDQFHQVDGTASRRHEGTGLGLTIADKYTQLLGGRIDVLSQPGTGSKFTLILPMNDIGKGLSSVTIPSEMQISAPTENWDKHDFGGHDNKTILVIEDSEPAIIQLSEILQEKGYRVEIARNGEDALVRVKTQIPDAIILDLMMPGMDGFEVLERIRGTEVTAKIPVLILTAKYLNKSELSRLTANNIYQLVQKGDVGKDELLNLIHNMIGKIRQSDTPLSKKAIPVIKDRIVNILLVEDNEDNVKTIEAFLSENFNLIVARDGAEGLEKAKRLLPDLILLDISLPIKDGFVVLREMRDIEGLQKIPVIAVTARAMKGDRESFLNFGFDDYLSKPVNGHHFQETISKWVLLIQKN